MFVVQTECVAECENPPIMRGPICNQVFSHALYLPFKWINGLTQGKIHTFIAKYYVFPWTSAENIQRHAHKLYDCYFHLDSHVYIAGKRVYIWEKKL